MSKTKPPGTNKPNELTRLFAEFAGNAPDTALVIHQPFLKLCKGDHLAALLLSQIIYWQGKTTDPDGWFSHSYEEWHAELYLSQYQVSRLVRGETNEKRKRKSDVFTLQSVGVETKRRRSRYHKGAATIHYRVNWHTLGLALKECFTEDEASPVVNIVDNESMTNINIVDNDDVNIVDNNVVNNASNVYIDYPETITEIPDATAPTASLNGKKKRTPKSKPEPSPERQAEIERNKAISAMMVAYHEGNGGIGKPNFKHATNRENAGNLVDAGITDAQVKAFIEFTRREPYWRDKTVSWNYIQLHIGEHLKRVQNGSAYRPMMPAEIKIS